MNSETNSRNSRSNSYSTKQASSDQSLFDKHETRNRHKHYDADVKNENSRRRRRRFCKGWCRCCSPCCCLLTGLVLALLLAGLATLITLTSLPKAATSKNSLFNNYYYLSET